MTGSERWGLTLGASVMAFDTRMELESDSLAQKVDETIVRPVLSARLNLSLTERWHLFSSIGYWNDSDVRITDLSIQAGYRFSHEWLITAGFRTADREIAVETIENDLQFDQLSLGIWYLW
jgi:hypothetical protein